MAKIIPISLFILLFFVGSHLVSSGQPDDGVLAVVEFIEGSTFMQLSGSDEWIFATESTQLSENDKLRTSDNSRTELKLKNGVVIRINQRTAITIDEAHVHALTDTGCIYIRFPEIFATYGEVWSIAEANSDLRTPVARVGGGKGVFRVSVENDGITAVKLYKGSMKVERCYTKEESAEIYKNREKAKKTGEEFEEPEYWLRELTAYQKIMVSSEGKIVYHGDFSPDDMDEKTDWVEWNKKRDNLK